MPLYEYTPIEEEEIRLLILQPGEDCEPIRFRIQCYGLNEPPAYQALSYVRGTEEDREAIFEAEGSARSIFVRRHLWHALGRLRHPTKEILLWVDEICINQSDMFEKSQRAQLMNRTYSHAAKVIAWLGEADQFTSTAFELVKKMRTQIPFVKQELGPDTVTDLQDARSLAHLAKLNKIATSQLRALRHLIEQQWLTPDWIIQERAFGPQVVVVCGKFSVAEEDIFIVSEFLYNYYQKRVNSSQFPRLEEEWFLRFWRNFREIVDIKNQSKLWRGILAFPGMFRRQDEIPEPLADTCQWILETPQHLQWESGSESVLWITGRPGAGKSTLMAFLKAKYKARPTSDAAIVLGFFFPYHWIETELQRTSLGMLQSLLYQLYSQNLTAFWETREVLEQIQCLSKLQDSAWRQHELKNLLSLALNLSAQNHDVFVFIDGLDEAIALFDFDIWEYFQRLTNLVNKSKTRLHICVSQRHYPVIAKADRLKVVSIEQHNEQDIALFVQQRLQRLKTLERSQSPDASVVESLWKRIVQKSAGDFTWVNLAVLRLAEMERQGKALEDIVADLQELLQVKDQEETQSLASNKKLIQLKDQEEIESLASNNLPSLDWSGSTASSIEQTQTTIMLAKKFAQTILEDNDLKPLYNTALQRMPFAKFERNIRRLLGEYAADLLQQARQRIERSAARIIKRHPEEVVELLRAYLDPRDVSKAAEMNQLSEREVNKDETMSSFLSGLSHNSGLWSGEPKCGGDDNSESSDDDDALSARFESLKPFLFNGDAFNNFKENFQQFVFPRLKDSRSATQKGAAETEAAEKIVKLQSEPESDAKSALEVISPQKTYLEDDGYRGELRASSEMYFDDFDSEPSIGDRLKVSIENILGQTVLWWPFKEPLRPLANGMRRFKWKCDCGSNVYFDVPSQSDTADAVRLPPLTESFTQAGNSQSLPLHNTTSINLQVVNYPAQPRLSVQGSNQAQPGPSNN